MKIILVGIYDTNTVSLAPHRLAKPVMKAHMIIEAEAGAFARWGLEPGDQLELRFGEEPRDDPPE